MLDLPLTTLFTGLMAVLQAPLTVVVGLRRVQTGVQFLDGGDETILRRMRAHGNFTETVPIVLLAMAAAELSGLPTAFLWAGGLSLLVGRALHAHILITRGWGITRAIGMIPTLLPMLGFGVWDLVQAVVAL